MSCVTPSVTPPVCISCSKGNLLDTTNNLCVSCSQTMPNCLYCDPSTCIECQYGYGLSVGAPPAVCQLCSDSIEGCLHCEDTATCLTCAMQYYLSPATGTCLACPTGCLQCELSSPPTLSSLTCLACLPSYMLKHSTAPLQRCVECETYLSGCQSCSSPSLVLSSPLDVCSLCYPEYFLSATTN